jgi:uncharacterized protein YxeA
MAGKRKLGWFLWTIIIAIFVTITGSGLLFYNLFNLDVNEILDRQVSTENKDILEETRHQIEETQETVGQAYNEIGEFIKNKHEFYNETTGYGGINNLDWSEQTEVAGEIIAYIDKNIDSVASEALENDLNALRSLASTILEEQNPTQVRDLHRYFHDLDIALNSYNGYDRIWNVTKTLPVNDKKNQ